MSANAKDMIHAVESAISQGYDVVFIGLISEALGDRVVYAGLERTGPEDDVWKRFMALLGDTPPERVEFYGDDRPVVLFQDGSWIEMTYEYFWEHHTPPQIDRARGYISLTRVELVDE